MNLRHFGFDPQMQWRRKNQFKTNVRIITATHRAYEEARLGRFRQDLLYRLRVFQFLFHHSVIAK